MLKRGVWKCVDPGGVEAVFWGGGMLSLIRVLHGK